MSITPSETPSITWNAPAALLEKLIAYEAVHEIRGWEDLKNRLDSDRRCFAFFHPRMPDEPLIFVEVALVDGMAGSIQKLLDETAPLIDPATANTAIFYSISNAQQGLTRISFGDFLIKQVVEQLSHEVTRIKMFATLSPVPGFRRWLEDRLASDEELLTAAESAGLVEAAGQERSGGQGRSGGDGAAALKALTGRHCRSPTRDRPARNSEANSHPAAGSQNPDWRAVAARPARSADRD